MPFDQGRLIKALRAKENISIINPNAFLRHGAVKTRALNISFDQEFVGKSLAAKK